LLACVRIDTHEWTEFARALTGEEEENRAQQDRVFPAACGSPQWQIRLSFYHHGSRDPHNARRTDPRTPRPTAQAAHYARDVGAGGAPSVRTTRSRARYPCRERLTTQLPTDRISAHSHTKAKQIHTLNNRLITNSVRVSYLDSSYAQPQNDRLFLALYNMCIVFFSS
jgi:hypothetical protein